MYKHNIFFINFALVETSDDKPFKVTKFGNKAFQDYGLNRISKRHKTDRLYKMDGTDRL